MADDTSADSVGRHRPKTATVFVAAFVAGAVAAVVVNRALDLHLAQSRPQVESEPIFVALRPLTQGAPVTVWDVALRDWPCAMLPASALRAGDSFEGSVLKYPLREGQPLLAVQLMPASPPPGAPVDASAPVEDAFVMPAPAALPVVAATAPKSEPPRDEAAATNASPITNDSVVADEAAVNPTAPQAATADATDTTKEPSKVVDVVATPKPEPTIAEPTLALVEPQPTPVASDVEPLLDIPSRPAVDLDSIPSVMAHSERPAEPVEMAPASEPVRYLVVPERIARQADTSFVSPPAVEPPAEATPPAPVAASQPPAVTATQAPAKRSAQNSAPRSTQAVPRTTAKTAAPKSAASTRSRSAQPVRPRSAQSAARSNPHERINGTANSTARPIPQERPQQQAQQPSQQGRQAAKPRQNQSSNRTVAEPSPRNWGGMFPNISAGIEAVGNRWRGGGDEAVATDIPSDQRRK